MVNHNGNEDDKEKSSRKYDINRHSSRHRHRCSKY